MRIVLDENLPRPLVRIFGHVGLLFVMPFVVVSGGLTLFETSQVKDTLGRFAFFSGIVLVPLFLIQLVGTVKKDQVTTDEVLAMIILGKKPDQVTQEDLAELR